MNRSIDWKNWIEQDSEELSLSQNSHSTEVDPNFPAFTQVTVVFRDKETLMSARRFCARMLRRFRPDSIRLMEWPFATLVDPSAFARAVADAAGSDMALLALRSEEPLPLLIKKWLRALRQRPECSTAAVFALFLRDHDDSLGVIAADQEIHACLQTTGLDYYSEAVRQSLASFPQAPPTHAERPHSPIPGYPTTAIQTQFAAASHWDTHE